jgi:hypothetical protein
MNSRVMPVSVVGPKLLACVGTAFNIASAGVLVTARHVIEAAIATRDRTDAAHIAVLWIGSGAGEDVQDLLGRPNRRAGDGRRTAIRVISHC